MADRIIPMQTPRRGSGANGRLTVEDFQAMIDRREKLADTRRGRGERLEINAVPPETKSVSLKELLESGDYRRLPRLDGDHTLEDHELVRDHVRTLLSSGDVTQAVRFQRATGVKLDWKAERAAVDNCHTMLVAEMFAARGTVEEYSNLRDAISRLESVHSLTGIRLEGQVHRNVSEMIMALGGSIQIRLDLLMQYARAAGIQSSSVLAESTYTTEIPTLVPGRDRFKMALQIARVTGVLPPMEIQWQLRYSAFLLADHGTRLSERHLALISGIKEESTGPLRPRVAMALNSIAAMLKDELGGLPFERGRYEVASFAASMDRALSSLQLPIPVLADIITKVDAEIVAYLYGAEGSPAHSIQDAASRFMLSERSMTARLMSIIRINIRDAIKLQEKYRHTTLGVLVEELV